MNLKDIRKKFNLSQLELGELIGVNQTTISRMERNELEMKLSEFGKLIKALDLSSEYYNSLIDDAIKNSKELKTYRKE